MRRLLIGDRKVRVRDEGEAGKKAPVVLIHGAGASSVVWIDVIRRLAGQRRVIAPDLPGHGQSDDWHAAHGEALLDLYRDAVGTICARLGVERAVLVGHSMGGAVALRCALASPARVTGLVLVGSGARMRVSSQVLATLANPDNEPREVIAAAAYAPSTAPEIVDRWRAVIVQAEREVLLRDLAACDGVDLRPRLAELNLPALAIGGSDDLMMPPKLSREFAEKSPNARVVIVPHTGHMIFHENLTAFHDALDPFLAEVA